MPLDAKGSASLSVKTECWYEDRPRELGTSDGVRGSGSSHDGTVEYTEFDGGLFV